MSTESPAPAPRLDDSPYRWAVLVLGSLVIMTSIGFTSLGAGTQA